MTGHSAKPVPSNLIYDTKVNPTHVTCKVTKTCIVKPSGKSDHCITEILSKIPYIYHMDVWIGWAATYQYITVHGLLQFIASKKNHHYPSISLWSFVTLVISGCFKF